MSKFLQIIATHPAKCSYEFAPWVVNLFILTLNFLWLMRVSQMVLLMMIKRRDLKRLLKDHLICFNGFLNTTVRYIGAENENVLDGDVGVPESTFDWLV